MSASLVLAWFVSACGESSVGSTGSPTQFRPVTEDDVVPDPTVMNPQSPPFFEELPFVTASDGTLRSPSRTPTVDERFSASDLKAYQILFGAGNGNSRYANPDTIDTEVSPMRLAVIDINTYYCDSGKVLAVDNGDEVSVRYRPLACMFEPTPVPGTSSTILSTRLTGLNHTFYEGRELRAVLGYCDIFNTVGYGHGDQLVQRCKDAEAYFHTGILRLGDTTGQLPDWIMDANENGEVSSKERTTYRGGMMIEELGSHVRDTSGAPRHRILQRMSPSK